MVYKDPEQKRNYHKKWLAGLSPERRAVLCERTQAWRAANPAKLRQYVIENKAAIRARQKAWQVANPDKAKLYTKRARYIKAYGLRLSEVEAMIVAQGGVCPLCETTLVLAGRRGAHVDHDHATGKVRGVLCCNCNTAIGHFKENVSAMRRAIDYLTHANGDEISLG